MKKPVDDLVTFAAEAGGSFENKLLFHVLAIFLFLFVTYFVRFGILDELRTLCIFTLWCVSIVAALIKPVYIYRSDQPRFKDLALLVPGCVPVVMMCLYFPDLPHYLLALAGFQDFMDLCGFKTLATVVCILCAVAFFFFSPRLRGSRNSATSQDSMPTASPAAKSHDQAHPVNVESNTIDFPGNPLAFVYFDDKSSALKVFVTRRFLPQLNKMRCTYVTLLNLPLGKPKSEGLADFIKQCSLFFVFPPFDQAKNLMDLLAYHVVDNPHSQSTIVPIQLSSKDAFPFYYRHLTAAKIDINNPDSEDNKQAYEQIRQIVDEKKSARQLRDNNASNSGKQLCHHETVKQKEPQGETTEMGPSVSSRKKKKSKKKKSKKTRMSENACTDHEDDTRQSKRIGLMEVACFISMRLTSKWITNLVGLSLVIDLCREFLIIGTIVMNIDNSTFSTNTETNGQPSQVTAVTICFVSIICKLIAGHASIFCLRRYAGSIQEMDLQAVMQRTDIQSIGRYLVKERRLGRSLGDMQPAKVLASLQSYLRSTEAMFCVLPWIHCGALVTLSLIGPFRDDHWHRQPESTNFQFICQSVDVVTTFLVLGFCHSGSSLYHLQSKILVDIVRVFTYRKDRNKPSTDIISAWNKLRGLVEDSMPTVFWFSIIGIFVQVIMIVHQWLLIPEKSKMEGEVIIARLLIHMYLLISEGMSNCPSRIMKILGLTLDGVMFLIMLWNRMSGDFEVILFPYGSVSLMAFRVLSYKMIFILYLHARLIKVSRDWPHQTEQRLSVSFRSLKLVMGIWACFLIIDCFPLI